jgi:hypothetical protein
VLAGTLESLIASIARTPDCDCHGDGHADHRATSAASEGFAAGGSSAPSDGIAAGGSSAPSDGIAAGGSSPPPTRAATADLDDVADTIGDTVSLLNNMLTVVVGNAELALMSNDPDAANGALKAIQQAAAAGVLHVGQLSELVGRMRNVDSGDHSLAV